MMLMRSAAAKSLIRRSAARAFSAGSTAKPTQKQKQKQKQGSSLNYEVVPKEYSVIFTNRSLNLMSSPFQRVMRDLNALLKETYRAEKAVIIPG
jgi:hypothetical protein